MKLVFRLKSPLVMFDVLSYYFFHQLHFKELGKKYLRGAPFFNKRYTKRVLAFLSKWYTS